VEYLRCPRCGGPAQPSETACVWCAAPIAPAFIVPTRPDPTPNPYTGPIQLAAGLRLSTDGGITNVFHVQDPNGLILARGFRAMEDLVGFEEFIVRDPLGRFLLAFRFQQRPGASVILGPIPYVLVDDQGQEIGLLRTDFHGFSGTSYSLWSQGEEYLSVPRTDRSKPYPVLQRGVPVAIVVEKKPFLDPRWMTSWTVHFSQPCNHLHVLGLVIRVALNRLRSHVGGP
jgi:hypothetical protein